MAGEGGDVLEMDEPCKQKTLNDSSFSSSGEVYTN